MTKKMVKATEVKTPETATEVKTTATEVKTPETAKKSTKAKIKSEPKVEEVKTETVETPVEVKTEEKPDFKKSKREELVGVLRTNFKLIKDDGLKDSIKYTVKKAEKATLSDLRNLVREVKKALGKEFNETPTYVAEASLKKAEKVETPVEEKSEPKAEPKAKKKSKKDNDTDLNEKAVQLATSSVFPEILNEYGEEYRLAHEIQSLEDLEKATESGEIMIACLWTKRHLRQFPYFNRLLGQPRSFKNDLDLCQLVWATSKVAYAVSNDTEAIYNFFPEDIVEEDGIRVSSGMEYQIYRKTGDETEEPEDEEETEE